MKYKKGMRLVAAQDSATPEVSMEIIETGIMDSDGFEAVKIRFNDGTEEVTATANLDYGISTGMRLM